MASTSSGLVGSLESAVRSNVELLKNLAKNSKDAWDHLEEAAEATEKAKDEAGVAALGASAIKLAEVQGRIKATLRAVQEVAGAYVVPQGTSATDFAGDIEGKVAAFLAAEGGELGANPLYNKFQKRVWNVHHMGEAMPGEDDELVDVGGDSLKNTRCPLSGKEVGSLDEPVQDQKGIVYERKVIEHLISKAPNKKLKCPQVGTSHMVSLEDLEVATHVVRARKRKAAKDARRADDSATVID